VVGWPERVGKTETEVRAMSKRAVLYARVSYDDRKNEARNLEGQIEDGRAYCREKGYQIVAELAEDDRGASGADWDLPKLNEALDMARAGEADVLVTRELDRFARGLAKQLVAEREFQQAGARVEYIAGEYPDTPEGRLNKHIRASVAEFERELITRRLKRGRRSMVKNGKIMLHGDKPPYGYRVEDGMLVIYEPEARIVRLIFTWYTFESLGYHTIARKLSEMRVLTWADIRGARKKRGRGEWEPSSIASIISNETYAGVWHYGKRSSGGKHVNSRDQWLDVEVPAIVSREVWEKAQERRAYNKEMAERNTKHKYLLGRRVTCGLCGHGMYGRTGGDGRYRYYCCSWHKLIGVHCTNKYFRASRVEGAVWEWVKDWLSNPEALREGLEKQRAEQERANKPLYDRLAVIDDLLSDNRRQLEKLLDLYLSGDFDKTMLTDRKTRLETTITALEKEQTDLAMFLESQLSDEAIATLTDFTKKVSAGLELAEEDFEAKRQIIDLLDVRATLTIEDGQKVAYVRCLVDETALSIESTTTKSDTCP
jgi:site-specific DNA recombinase